MSQNNLRHLRYFLAVVDTASPSRAADQCGVTQPAVTQAMKKLEHATGALLFERKKNGFFLTEKGKVFEFRVRRALERLDSALSALAPRLVRTASWAQLDAVTEVAEARSFSEAARRLGLAQPTIHRALREFEREAERALFDQTSIGLTPTRACRKLIQAIHLSRVELEQAQSELADLDGREEGRIVIGALPLSRTVILPRTLAQFRKKRARQAVSIVEGTYPDLLDGLLRGAIDIIIGALRDPAPSEDVVQEALFEDKLTFLAAPDHPAVRQGVLSASELRRFQWIVPRAETPARMQFEKYFTDAQVALPTSIIDCGSILLMRELLGHSDMLGCISERQAAAEVSKGLLAIVQSDANWGGRLIGMTLRREWKPTLAQKVLLDTVRATAGQLQS